MHAREFHLNDRLDELRIKIKSQKREVAGDISICPWFKSLPAHHWVLPVRW